MGLVSDVEPSPQLTSPGKDLSRKDLRSLNCLFWSLFFLQITVNFDNGCVPAVLSDITEEFRFSPILQGYLLSFQYIGLTSSYARARILVLTRWLCPMLLMTAALLAPTGRVCWRAWRRHGPSRAPLSCSAARRRVAVLRESLL